MTELFYEHVFSNLMQLSDQHLGTIVGLREKLEVAATEYQHELGSIYAINMCLNVAGSIILSNPRHLATALDALRAKPELARKDHTTVLTVITLYRLILWDFRKAQSQLETEQDAGKKLELKEYQENLKRLTAGFDSINWFIGKAEMDAIDLRPGALAPANGSNNGAELRPDDPSSGD